MTATMSSSEEAISPVSPSTPEMPLICSSLRYEDVIGKLIEPLASHLIKVRPGATTKDKKKAIALAYYDWRVLVNRLNRLVGGRNWHVHLEPWGANKLICTLTILGVQKESTGEGEDDDENGGTSAEQQAKKRAMAEHGFNYLYLLPEVWGDYDADRKRFVNPQALVDEMYRNARIERLDLLPYISSTRSVSGKRASAKASAPTSPVASPPAGTVPPESLPTAEKAISTFPLDEKILKGIGKLCTVLGKAEPEYATLTAHSAQQLFTQLTNEYRAERARSAAIPASTH